MDPKQIEFDVALAKHRNVSGWLLSTETLLEWIELTKRLRAICGDSPPMSEEEEKAEAAKALSSADLFGVAYMVNGKYIPPEWVTVVLPAKPVAGELPPLPAGYSVTRVDGHGWYIDPPQGGRWVAHEGTPAADLIAALRQPVQQPAAFPERDHSKPAEQQGVFRKFDVRRLDGSDAPGGKHHGCRYFVLDMDHDQHAAPALAAYAVSCAVTHPALSAELAAEFGQPDSGRDAALGFFDTYNTGIKPWSQRIPPNQPSNVISDAMQDELNELRRALAAHPAPSSDAAALWEALYEMREWYMQHGNLHHTDILSKAQAALSIPPAAHPANGAQAGLSDAHRAVIAEAAQVLESAAAHNRSKSRTVLAHTQQERADRLREVFLAAAPQKKEG